MPRLDGSLSVNEARPGNHRAPIENRLASRKNEGRDERMQPSFTIGRIAGIKVSFNWSWLIIFGLIVWSLESSVFPAQDPGLSRATYVIMALIAAFVFFASLLMHELGHSIVARRNGMEIEGITLWLFGGVAQFKEMFRSPGAEFRIGRDRIRVRWPVTARADVQRSRSGPGRLDLRHQPPGDLRDGERVTDQLHLRPRQPPKGRRKSDAYS
jgi:hypothetical protein